MSISVNIDRDAQVITWTSDKTATMVTAHVGTMSDDCRARAMYHGINQRGTDSGAIAFGKLDGKDKPSRYPTDEEKLARIGRTVEHLNNPTTGWDWDLRPSRDPLAGKSKEQLEALVKEAQKKLAALGIG